MFSFILVLNKNGQYTDECEVNKEVQAIMELAKYLMRI
jgi:hypothetical protein